MVSDTATAVIDVFKNGDEVPTRTEDRLFLPDQCPGTENATSPPQLEHANPDALAVTAMAAMLKVVR